MHSPTVKSLHYGSLFFLFMAQTMGGINIVGAKFLVSTISIPTILVLRFTLAALFLFILYFMRATPKKMLHEIKRVDRVGWLFIFAQALCAGVLFNFLMLWGLHSTSANVAGITTSALPAMVAVMAWLFLREHMSTKIIACIIFATIGLILINLHFDHTMSNNTSLWGGILVFLSLLPEAAYYVLSKIHRSTLNIFLLSAIINAINAIILLFFVGYHLPSQILQFDFPQLVALVAISLGSGLFYVFWVAGSKHVASHTASMSIALMPITTIIIAWLVLAEKITMLQFAGMCLVILSIVICVRRSSKSY